MGGDNSCNKTYLKLRSYTYFKEQTKQKNIGEQQGFSMTISSKFKQLGAHLLTENQVNKFLKTIEVFPVTKIEIFHLVNLQPRTIVEFYIVVKGLFITNCCKNISLVKSIADLTTKITI